VTDGREALIEVLRGCGLAVAAAVRRLRAEQPPAALAEEQGLGADGAPTSRIDLVAEQAALAFLDALPSRWRFNILSEERGLIERGAGLTLVIDPIDSTNNAVSDFPYYAFSIAAVDGRPLAGCVINLPTGDCWTASRGAGATLNGRRLPRGAVTALGEAILAAVRPMTEADLDRLRPALFKARRVRITGCTALDVCLVAGGTLHGFVNPNRYTNPIWGEKVVDYAAAALVLEETGGALCDQGGAPLAYPLDLRHRLCLQAAATPALLAAILRALGTHG
jgi:fructose-1,6-bisphosphatase/inositol monophosphatase family enzyme